MTNIESEATLGINLGMEVWTALYFNTLEDVEEYLAKYPGFEVYHDKWYCHDIQKILIFVK